MIASLILALLSWSKPPTAYGLDYDEPDETSAAVRQLAASAYIAWWSLDAMGYHPAVMVRIENISGRDLSGQPVRFQGRFMDMREGVRTTARKEIRQSLSPYEKVYVFLKGPQAFQLPIDVSVWPPIECKVMCRVGDVDDEGTQTLLETKLEQITMSDDDAYHKVSRMADYSQLPAPKNYPSTKPRRPASPARPLSATAGSLNGLGRGKPPPTPREDPRSSVAAYAAARVLPGLGDDFYQFEKAYGLPTQTDTKDPGWTWAVFKHASPDMTVVTGSKGTTGKVDFLIVQVPASGVAKESTVVDIGRLMSGRSRGAKIGALSPSVRYLPAGRVQVVAGSAPGYQFAYLPPRGPSGESNSYILILSRVSGAIDALMSEHARRAEVLRPFKGYFGSG